MLTQTKGIVVEGGPNGEERSTDRGAITSNIFITISPPPLLSSIAYERHRTAKSGEASVQEMKNITRSRVYNEHSRSGEPDIMDLGFTGLQSKNDLAMVVSHRGYEIKVGLPRAPLQQHDITISYRPLYRVPHNHETQTGMHHTEIVE
jgi:hypothetical protein